MFTTAFGSRSAVGPIAVASQLYTTAARFSYGPVLRYLRERRIRSAYDVEPAWRRRSGRLQTGYQKPW